MRLAIPKVQASRNLILWPLSTCHRIYCSAGDFGNSKACNSNFQACLLWQPCAWSVLARLIAEHHDIIWHFPSFEQKYIDVNLIRLLNSFNVCCSLARMIPGRCPPHSCTSRVQTMQGPSWTNGTMPQLSAQVLRMALSSISSYTILQSTKNLTFRCLMRCLFFSLTHVNLWDWFLFKGLHAFTLAFEGESTMLFPHCNYRT